MNPASSLDAASHSFAAVDRCLLLRRFFITTRYWDRDCGRQINMPVNPELFATRAFEDIRQDINHAVSHRPACLRVHYSSDIDLPVL